jgi:tetratricopeptide (TPR) repeat protein
MRKAVLGVIVLALVPAAFGQAGMSPAEAKRAEAYFHFSMARILDQQEEWDEAVKEYKKALEATPDDAGLHTALARTYFNQRNREEAIKTAEKAIELNRDTLGAHKLLADIYVSMLQRSQASSQAMLEATLDKAIQAYEEIVRIEPRGAENYLFLANLYRIDEAPDKAAALLKKLLGFEPASEDAVLGLVNLAVDSGNNAEATEILKEFLKSQPNSVRALEMLGDSLSTLGDTAGAADAFKRAVDLSNDSELKVKLAEALLADGRLDEAARAFEEILKEDQGSIPILRQLGQIYRRQMRYAEAREVLNRALTRSRNSIQVRFDLAMLERDEGNFESAIRIFETLLKETEKVAYNQDEKASRALFYTHIGLLNSLMTRYDLTIAAFNNVRSLSDPSQRYRIDLMIADTYRAARDLDSAQTRLQEALKDNPNRVEVQMSYADLIANRGRVEEGIQILEKLGAGKDPNLDLLSAMIGIYERASRFAEAQKVLDSAAKSFSNNGHVHFLQGALYERQDLHNQAEQSFRKALEFDKNDPSTLNYLGYMMADRGVNLEEALAMIQKAVDADPTNGAFLDSLGWVYFKMEKLDLAERFLKRAVIFAATNATMHDHLGDLYFKAARYREAEASWTTGLKYADDPEEAQQIRQKLEQVKSRTVSR